MCLYALYSALFALKTTNHRMPHKKYKLLIYVILMAICLGSCATSKYSCHYPDPPPRFNQEGEIIREY